MDPAPTTVPVPPPLLPAWPRCVQIALAFLLGAGAASLAASSFGIWRGSSGPSEDRSRVLYRINLNTAERADLTHLPHVGEVLAERIVEHRALSGGFRSVDDLRKVPGIGRATLEQLRPWVYVDGGSESAEPQLSLPTMAPPRAGVGPKKVANLLEPINLNRATAEELQRLPGIGPKLSQRIVEERLKGGFRTVEDLRRVPGIGPKTIEKLKPFVTTGAPAVALTGTE